MTLAARVTELLDQAEAAGGKVVAIQAVRQALEEEAAPQCFYCEVAAHPIHQCPSCGITVPPRQAEQETTA